MMSIFTARLEACDPARDCFRAYLLEAGPDLFGAWLVEAMATCRSTTAREQPAARRAHPPHRQKIGGIA